MIWDHRLWHSNVTGIFCVFFFAEYVAFDHTRGVVVVVVVVVWIVWIVAVFIFDLYLDWAVFCEYNKNWYRDTNNACLYINDKKRRVKTQRDKISFSRYLTCI